MNCVNVMCFLGHCTKFFLNIYIYIWGKLLWGELSMALLACQRCLICITVQCGGNQLNVLKKEKVVHHQFFVLRTGYWGELSWGELSVGRVVMGRVVPGASCPWGELSMG